MALTVLALTILIADRAVHGPMPRRRSALPVGLIGLTTAAVFAQMLLGSWVTGHDAGLAYPDFPLMNGGLLPAIDAPPQAIQVAHRALAMVVAGLVVWTAVVVWRRTRSRLPRTLAAVAVGLVVVQVALGAANVWSRLSAAFVVPHLAVGAALFATCFWLVLAALREPAVARNSARGAPIADPDRHARPRRHPARVRRADQAAHHRAAAGDDRPDHGPRPARRPVACG